MRVRISSPFNKKVWRLKDDHARSEEVRRNLENMLFRCFLSGPLKHKIHYNNYDA